MIEEDIVSQISEPGTISQLQDVMTLETHSLDTSQSTQYESLQDLGNIVGSIQYVTSKRPGDNTLLPPPKRSRVNTNI